ncbi:MAG: C-GCAxxG-C-C family protein [Peptoniphilus sp.]|nr:C-GCAxxG-C-C family protein [Peptoniphilus sp.]MDD7362565.1 C-GCAxxG-C-C family protein [Bacillota bacterium]MDY6045036.1 C-GCAxxG-C-C family protein [Peptoniphilus sp.]
MSRADRHCAQRVLGAFAKDFGLDEGTADRIAAAFGGGRFRGETCGCVVASDIVLGLAYGDDPDKLFARSMRFESEFAQRHGSTDCRDILGHDLSKPGEMERARADGSIKRHCPRCIEDSISILRDLLDDA